MYIYVFGFYQSVSYLFFICQRDYFFRISLDFAFSSVKQLKLFCVGDVFLIVYVTFLFGVNGIKGAGSFI
jgi:hypothetical protein